MILSNVFFGSRRRHDPEQLRDAAESYLVEMARAGQISGEYFLSWTRGRLNAHVLLACRSATELRYHSQRGKRELKQVADAFGKKPLWRILDDGAPQRPPSWKDAPFLYLFTNAFDRFSPVCRGDGKASIPVCLLPLAFEYQEQLYFWQRTYRHLDHIWLDSGALEIAAYRQLADPESEVSRNGRDLCKEIEAATGVPTYYYLMRYWGRPNGEDQRRCPGCGGAWRAERPQESPGRFWLFDFKCERCRLASHKGVSLEGGRHARIGEFDENVKANKTLRRKRSPNP